MKVYKTNEIKNISLVGGKGAGKTTLTESILLEGGAISRRGTVDGGNTVSDNTPVEKEYGYSVSSCVFFAEKNGKKLNFFDCPGSDDFVGNAVTALSVTDTAALVVDGRNGVEVGTQNNFRTVERIGKPLMFVINRLEDEKCDFDNVYNQLRETYGNKVVALQFPVNAGPGFDSVVDVLAMKQYTWPKDGGKATVSDIDGSLADKAEEYRMALLELAAENDEELMMKFLDEMTLSDEETIKGIRLGMVDRSIFPIVLVSAEK
ncbi:MAG: GTP-binding protein, partial [Muribaculaceae bacterium]|nr:GTP-binding protein [Muribaculaceae bacterium]